MTSLQDPIPVSDSESQAVEQTREHGECPECGGRATPAGSTPSKTFMECGYCGNSFSEHK